MSSTKTVKFPVLDLKAESGMAVTAEVHKEADYTVPGVALKTGHAIAEALQDRLYGLNELALILKHAHWNVTGPQFIAVHEMLDSQTDAMREFVDEIAERIAAMGVSPNGLSGALVANRKTPEYPLGRANAQDHLRIIDKFYTYNIESHRAVLAQYGELDPMTEDLLVSQTRAIEKLQWFLRAHIDQGNGQTQ